MEFLFLSAIYSTLPSAVSDTRASKITDLKRTNETYMDLGNYCFFTNPVIFYEISHRN